MIQHEPYPVMPEETFAKFCRLCEQTRGKTQGIYDPDSRMLVIAHLDQGRITGWTIEGPMSLEFAADVIREGVLNAIQRYYGEGPRYESQAIN